MRPAERQFVSVEAHYACWVWDPWSNPTAEISFVNQWDTDSCLKLKRLQDLSEMPHMSSTLLKQCCYGTQFYPMVINYCEVMHYKKHTCVSSVIQHTLDAALMLLNIGIVLLAPTTFLHQQSVQDAHQAILKPGCVELLMLCISRASAMSYRRHTCIYILQSFQLHQGN